jgi:hypothetical protein
MTYRSTGIRHSEDGFDVGGELTLHGVTRPVTLALDINGFTRDPYGNARAGFSATTEINRNDFGIAFNIPMDGGGVVIGDRIQIFIEVEAILNPPEDAADACRRQRSPPWWCSCPWSLGPSRGPWAGSQQPGWP